MSEQTESKFAKRLVIALLTLPLLGLGLILSAVLALTSAIGEDNSSDLGDAGFGGGLSDTKDIPSWLRPIIIDAVAKYGCTEVTPSLIAAQLYQESNFRTNPPDGGAGALGIAQFIPSTWDAEGIDGNNDGKKDPLEPKDAVPSMVSYDCKMAKEIHDVPGDVVDNMLAAYNAGAGKVRKYGGIPPYDETRNYVREIRERAVKWAAAADGKVTGGLAQVVATAKKALYTPYVFGGDCKPPFLGASGCDCSSLVKYAWSSVGVNLPRTTYDQVDIGSVVQSVKDLRPGDLMFSGGSASSPEHVSMYIGGGEVIDAPHTGAEVRIKPLSFWEGRILTMKRPDYTEPPTGGGSGGWVTPVSDHSIGTAYGVAGSMWSSGYHTGVDFPVPSGTVIRSVGPGVVVTAGWSNAYGNQVVIKHADGMYSQYAHMSALTASEGQQIKGGQQIGVSGATGNVTGAHLHFEIRTGPEYGSDIDPLHYLRGHGVSI
ncbi:peptidoglycan DD-metalloendopeptidase family protein [Streptomyces sp. NPDC096339]|uniref:peptidoglycan DD-metalloendopeptidase family protein n=1 Tax=Streptomyces sp. NPDC096339 TaxID=3366086 RepID=UPI0038276B5C